jgi:hypothetical protein
LLGAACRLVIPIEHPTLLVTGCPRSGTKYISLVLRALGADVAHHTPGRRGVASWCMAVPATTAPWGPPRHEHQRFDVVLHQVRNPALVIPSMFTLTEESWAFVYQHIACDPTEPLAVRCARFWYHWNRRAEEIAHWRYRIEVLDSVFATFCEKAAVVPDPSVFARVGPSVNTRALVGWAAIGKRVCDRLGWEVPAFVRVRYVDRSVYQRAARFDWHTLRRLDARLTHDVWRLALEYGYSEAELEGR